MLCLDILIFLFLNSAHARSAGAKNDPLVTAVASYIADATPNSEKANVVVQQVSDVVVSPGRGFYQAPVEVSMLCATAGSQIRYTFDGSEPTVTTGTFYSGPIRIDGTSVLRAAAFRNGSLPSRSITHTYIFLNDVVQQSQSQALAAGFPAQWNGTNADYGLDPRVVGPQDNYGGKYRESLPDDLRALPSMSIVMTMDDLFGPQGIYSNPTQRGDAWERPGSLELIYPDGRTGFQENAGVQIQGNASRRFSYSLKKSFRITFRSEYGHGMLKFPLFGQKAAQEFNNFVLRAGSNDGWPEAKEKATYLRDAWAMEALRAMGQYSSHTDFVHLYLNGLYWGLYQFVERPDAAFATSYLGGDRNDWDAINQNSEPDGYRDAWNRLQAAAKHLADNARYQFIQGNNPDGSRNPAYEVLIDIQNLIDYVIMNIYVGNGDWGNNWWADRNRKGGDGFKFFPWDTDLALGLRPLEGDAAGTSFFVFTDARANAHFRVQLADQIYRHFSEGGAFYVDPKNPAWDPAHPERNVPAARFAQLASHIERAMVGESARWGDQLRSNPLTRDEHWKVERDRMLADYFPRRSAILLDQFRNAGLYPYTEPPRMNQRGPEVPAGFLLELSAPAGSIFYTTNGTDPQPPVLIKELSRTTLVPREAAKKVFVPPPPPPPDPRLPSGWWDTGFDDSTWTSAAGGIGYDRETNYISLIQTDLRAAMENTNSTVLVRIPFTYAGVGQGNVNYMLLRVQYDDGFAAFLNGVLIASANPTLFTSSQATYALTRGKFSHAMAENAGPDAVQFEDFNANSGLSALRAGDNILAIEGLNVGASDSDFLLAAELVVGERSITPLPNDAIAYTGPIRVMDGMNIKARAVATGEWSALGQATFAVGTPSIVISELHFHPANFSAAERAAGFTDENDFEFLELYNNGTGSADLTGFHFTSGIQFQFPTGNTSFLSPGEYLLLVRNRAAFESRYGTGLKIAGEYSGRLDNAGERITLQNANGETVQDFTYGTLSPWPQSVDGGGYSLEKLDLGGDPQLPSNWRASAQLGGSPGKPRPAPTLVIDSITINSPTLRLTFQGRSGARYNVLTADSLSGPWTSIKTNAPLSQDQTVQIDIPIKNEPGSHQFFRIAVD